MRKRHFVYVFALLSTGFLLLQFGIYHNAARRKSDSETVEGEEEHNAAYLAIQLFMDACHKQGFPVFIIEPRVLQVLLGNHSSVKSCDRACPSWCHYLCSNHRVTTFGVASHLWIQTASTLKIFPDHGFFVSVFSHSDILAWYQYGDIRNLSSAGSALTHSLFQHSNGHVIHLVFFHRRGDEKYLWHGQMSQNGTGLDALLTTDLQFGQYAGSYSSIDLVKVVLDGIKLRVPKKPSSFLSEMPKSRFVECDHDRAAAFFTKYGQPDMNGDTIQFRTAARDILMTAKHVLDGIGVQFWISSGTCLGWFRQCDLIPYSKDVDIGIWIKDYDDRLISSMQNNGLSLLHRFGKVEDSFELSFVRDDVKLDIFFFYDEPDYMWNGGTQARTGKKFKYIFQRFTLCWTEFLGLRLRVPCETLAYVEANYGKDWFHPVKTWDWKKSPANVYENGEWPEDERRIVIQQFN